MNKKFLKGKIHLVGIFLIPPTILGIIFIKSLVLKIILILFLLFLTYLIYKIIVKSNSF